MSESTRKQRRDFLVFEYGPRNRPRRGRGGSRRLRVRDEVTHGEYLQRQVEGIQRSVSEQNSSRPTDLPDLPEEVQVILETDGLSPDDLHSFGLNFIEEREGGCLVAVSPDTDLQVFADKTEAYKTEKAKKDQPRYRNTVGRVNELYSSSYEDKVGDRLDQFIQEGKLHPDEQIWVDVEIAGGRSEWGELNRQQFSEYVVGLNEDVHPGSNIVVASIDTELIEDDYSLHRTWLPGRAIRDLLDNSRANWILLIDLIPQIEDDTIRLRSVNAAAIPDLPELSNDAPCLVIIDSGIASGHPLFKDGNGRTIIGRERNLLPESIEPPNLTADEVDGGHGTAVASIAAYGSVKAFVLHQDPAAFPECWIENAKILLPASKLDPNLSPDLTRLHPSQLCKTLMREVVEQFHQTKPHRCKVFNLSVGSAPHRLKQPISNWAQEIDQLSARNDILFVVAAGNLSISELQRYLRQNGYYPWYLLDQRARLRNPSQAYSALTVGAITDSDVLPPRVRGTQAPLAPAWHPSPFSRTGLLAGGLVKPDVIEIGGNLTDQFRQYPELSVPVANRGFISGDASHLITYQCGTSLAAPAVANLAGRILAANPNASANLLRALIVNSAEWPDALIMEHPVPGAVPRARNENMLRLCGYGVPQPDKALSANTHCMVFVAEDEFTWSESDTTATGRRYGGKASFFLVHFDPDALRNLRPGIRVRVSITLAFNPQVRKTWRNNYLGVELRWEMKRRYESSEKFRARWIEVLDNASDDEVVENQGESVQIDQWPWVLKPTLNPGGRARKGTIIRDWFEIEAYELPDPIEIAVLATVAPWATPPEPLTQRFALVVSVESLNLEVPIYDEIRVQPQVQIRA